MEQHFLKRKAVRRAPCLGKIGRLSKMRNEVRRCHALPGKIVCKSDAKKVLFDLSPQLL